MPRQHLVLGLAALALAAVELSKTVASAKTADLHIIIPKIDASLVCLSVTVAA